MQNYSDNYNLIIKIASELDIVHARSQVKQFMQSIGFSLADMTKIATAVSELARNIYRYAGQGVIKVREVSVDGEPGIEIIAEDEGPGIEDVEKALEDGFSTIRSLGLGLPGVKRLVDRFHIESSAGKGTKVTIFKKNQRKRRRSVSSFQRYP